MVNTIEVGRYQNWKQKGISRDCKEWEMKRFEGEIGPKRFCK
jgi:hypothetical protein